MKKPICLLAFFLLPIFNSFTQTEDTAISKLFRDSYYAIKSMRQSNGIYQDALILENGSKPGAIVANGVGLISLCIADSMYKKTDDSTNWEPYAEDMVNQTLQQFINFKSAGKTNTKGFYRRYFDINTGNESPGWGTEYSTIDNAIFAMGIYACKNYFSNNSEITNKADSILNSMDFTSAISEDGDQLFMVLDQNGNGNAPIGAFNEYIIVAWLAKNVSCVYPGYSKSQEYWEKYYSNPLNINVSHPNYWGLEMISDGGFISHFIYQFAYYYCHYFRNQSIYMDYFVNSRKADSLWWQKAVTGINNFEWGLGAGEIPGNGYSANAIDNNALQIISPQIIAGYIPICEESKHDLKYLIQKRPVAAVYKLPEDSTRKVLWRYRYSDTTQRCQYIQAVDFSTMIYGLASLPEYLGSDFFDRINNIPNSSTCNQIKKVKTIQEICIGPNPFHDKILIRLPENGIWKNIEIVDCAGRKLIKMEIMDLNEYIDLSQLSNGIYFIRLTKNYINYITKIVKN
jgi:hypothetical protein